MRFDDFNIDFAVILAGLTLFTGIVWALDKWLLAPRRIAALKPDQVDKPNAVIEFARSFFPVIFAVLMLRSFLVEPFRIPSGSMIPTLLVGDFILVNKFTFGLRDPVFHNKFVSGGEPQRGDVVVFRYPLDPGKDFIKRVIGLPGDRIEYRDKTLTVNGQRMPEEADGVYTAPGLPPPGMVYRFNEDLGGVKHHVLVNPGRPADDFEFVVPQGQYFMMGDNRDGSDDSRRWGTVPERNLVGKAFFIWMSWDSSRFWFDWSRIGRTID